MRFNPLTGISCLSSCYVENWDEAGVFVSIPLRVLAPSQGDQIIDGKIQGHPVSIPLRVLAPSQDQGQLNLTLAYEAGVSDKEPVEGEWNELKELTDVQFHGLLDLLRENKWPLPEAGYELEGADGEIIASAELGWEALKIAFLTDDEIKYRNQFVDKGWKTIPIAEILNEPEKYMNLGGSSGGSN